MQLQRIEFETAQLAKDVDFDLLFGRKTSITTTEIISGYDEDGILNSMNKDLVYPAPTQELLKKWLRERQNIFLELEHSSDLWEWRWVFEHPNYWEESYKMWYTYEEALEEGLQVALKYLKEQQKTKNNEV